MALDHYVTLGRSGLRVSPFALGAMTFGDDPGGAGSSVEESEKILTTYLDRGGNFIDTANFYTNGHSEKILGDYFAANPGRRDHVILASKFFTNMFPGDPNGGGAGRRSIIAQLDESLRRMRTDYLDLYWLHNWDRHTPVEETMRDPRRPGPCGQDPLHRLFQHPRLGHRAGPDDGTAEELDPVDRAAGRVLAAGPHRRRGARAARARPGHGIWFRGARCATGFCPANTSAARRSPTRPGRLSSAARARTNTGSSTLSPPSPRSWGPPRRRCRWPGYAPAKARSCRSWALGAWITWRRTSLAWTSA